MQRKDFIRIAVIVGAILLIPVFGNLFVEGWDWGVFDFVLMGALLYATGLAITFVTRKIADPMYRVLACGVILLILIVLWAELAVDAVSHAIGWMS